MTLLMLSLHLGGCYLGDIGLSTEEAGIIGTWEFLSSQSEGGTVEESTVTFTVTTMTIVFTDIDCTEIATYTLAGGTLTLTITSANSLDCLDDVGQVIEFQATVSGDTLTLEFDEAGSTGFSIVFRRVT